VGGAGSAGCALIRINAGNLGRSIIVKVEAVPSPRPYGERVRVRGSFSPQRQFLPLTPTLSPVKRSHGGEGEVWPMPTTPEHRAAFVARQIERRGVRDPRVLAAMRAVPREVFVPRARRAEAYLDEPLPIGAGQTISQPYIVAVMIEALGLKGAERVLEVGAGSGYAAALLAQIAGEVLAIERIESLADLAAINLAAAGCRNVRVRHGDGSLGAPDAAPFDAILVSAGAPEVPRALVAQLAIGGRMVVPVGGDTGSQRLYRITRVSDGETREERLVPVRFVPLIGEEGWSHGENDDGA
jgi:protein-L-isoaspartate(D-aspartate) O-methyltransferase